MQENITDQEAVRFADARLRAVLHQDRDRPGSRLTGISPISCFAADLLALPLPDADMISKTIPARVSERFSAVFALTGRSCYS